MQEISKQYEDLLQQLIADGVGSDHEIMRTARSLGDALRGDGIRIPESKQDVEDPNSVVKAFRVVTTKDAETITSVFTKIDGWRTKTIETNGKVFVIVANTPEFDKTRVRQALHSLSQSK
jgi:hypothetical protein